MFEIFLEIAKELNQMWTTSLLIGTVGLEDRTGRLWQARVVDIHVPSNPRGWEVPDEEQIYRTVELTAMSMNFRKTVFL